MRMLMKPILAIFNGLFVASCAGGEDGPGYLFHIIFIVVPLIAIGILLLRRTESTNDSLYIVEGQLKRLSSKLDVLEKKVSEGEEKGKNDEK